MRIEALAFLTVNILVAIRFSLIGVRQPDAGNADVPVRTAAQPQNLFALRAQCGRGRPRSQHLLE